jgi:ABC-type proline/glycine betaine transport systems, ATPase components
MDEPFSAVDPVVRDGLQEELLRLQGELGKTILFVTHDIDEAIKVGDVVAVLREGGRLAQYAPPAELLARPPTTSSRASWAATAGTAGPGLPRRRGDAGPRARPGRGRNGRGQSRGTARRRVGGRGRHRGAAGGLDRRRRPRPVEASTPVQDNLLAAGGSLYDVDVAASGRGGAAGSLRSALDAALSSPSGLGVAVDRTGAVVGAVAAADVLAALGAARRAGEVPS